jgi:hypothetical protein
MIVLPPELDPCDFIKLEKGAVSIEKKQTYYRFHLNDYYNGSVYYQKDQSNPAAFQDSLEKKGTKSVQEEIRLKKIWREAYRKDVVDVNIPAWLFLYADFVKPTLMAESYGHLLKLLPYRDHRGRSEHGGFYSFPTLDFFPVSLKNLTSPTFELKTHDGFGVDFNAPEEEIRVSLLFKKCADKLSSNEVKKVKEKLSLNDVFKSTY